jgi:hypothetical protein
VLVSKVGGDAVPGAEGAEQGQWKRLLKVLGLHLESARHIHLHFLNQLRLPNIGSDELSSPSREG